MKKMTHFSNLYYWLFNCKPKRFFFFLTSLFLLFSSQTSVLAQSNYTKFWVSFADKIDVNAVYSIDEPQAFLSERAIQRRLRFNIPITETDLPVSSVYLQKIKNIGADILYTSKWLNGALIYTEESAILKQIESLNFVKNVKAVGKNRRKSKSNTYHSPKFAPVELKTEEEDYPEESIYYGEAFHQIEMLKGDYLHSQGFMGEGMLIAVMDAGFADIDRMEVFQHLFENQKIVGAYDFVDIDSNPYHDSTHGTHVLSTIAAKIPGQFVGTAPNAHFWLFRTEDNKSEYSIEEYNWVAAAEMADSAGVDVINTSLGYTTFNDSQMDYTQKDLDGNTTAITRGADMAASTGMLVVVSAGNKGNKRWRYLTAPADADSVLTVGAVDGDGDYAIFSSVGLGNSDKVKPNLVAQGQSVEAITIDGSIYRANGTSFSAPILAGLATCLWQAHPRQSAQDIINILEKSSSQFLNPSDLVGYGIPDFRTAHTRLSAPETTSTAIKATAFVYPNPFDSNAQIYYYSPRSELITLQLFSLTGQLYEQYQAQINANEPYKFDFSAWQKTPKGIYVVRIANDYEHFALRAVKTSD